MSCPANKSLQVRSALILSTLAVALLCGCSGTTRILQEKLDPETAVTITRSRTPLVFYGDRSYRAAYARDFVYLGPIEVNRMGRYRYYLWLGIWSTLPGVLQADQRLGFDSVTLVADGEPLPLELAGWTEDAIGASTPAYTKPVASATDAFYEVTIDQIRLISEAHDLRLLTSGSRASSFELWNGQQSAFAGLRDFLQHAAY